MLAHCIALCLVGWKGMKGGCTGRAVRCLGVEMRRAVAWTSYPFSNFLPRKGASVLAAYAGD